MKGKQYGKVEKSMKDKMAKMKPKAKPMKYMKKMGRRGG